MITAAPHAWLRRVSDYHSGGVSATERAAVEAHLADCAECRLALAAYRRLYTLARSPLRLGDGGAGPLMEYQSLLLEETMLTTDRDTRNTAARPPRRIALTTLGAIPAVLLIAILAGTLFTYFQGRSHPVTPHPTVTPTATVAPLTWRQATLPDGYALPGPNTTRNGFAISPADGQRAWACAPVANRPGAFTVWATHDAAATWRQVSTLAPQAPETPLAGCQLTPDEYDPHTLIAQVGEFYCNTCDTLPPTVSFLSTDDGATWQSGPGNVVIGELATNNGTVYALIQNQTKIGDYLVTITHASGVLTVRQTGLPALADGQIISRVWMHPPDPVLYAGDTGGRFWRSDDAGAHWTALGGAPAGFGFIGRWIEPQHHWLFCMTSSDVAQCSDDGGQSWPPRLTQGVARGCTIGGITADGLLLAACADHPNTSQPSTYTLTRFAPGALTAHPIGTVPSLHFTLTATGQIWGFNSADTTVYVATLAG